MGQSKEGQANFLIKILGLTTSSVGITVGVCRDGTWYGGGALLGQKDLMGNQRTIGQKKELWIRLRSLKRKKQKGSCEKMKSTRMKAYKTTNIAHINTPIH